MKKVLISLAIVLISNPAFALLASVESLENFSTKNPPKTLKVRALKDFRLTSDMKIYKDAIIEGSIKVKPPKRLKRDATFTFIPLNYSYNEGDVHFINNKYSGKYIKPIDKKNVAKSAVLKVSNSIVPGVSAGYNLVKGAFENTEGNVAKSAAKSFYDNSPLSFLKKGNDIDIKNEEQFKIFFKPQREKIKKSKVDVKPVNDESADISENDNI